MIDLRWSDLRGVELVMDEGASDFSDEEPLEPSLREALDTAKAKLLSSVRQLANYRNWSSPNLRTKNSRIGCIAY